ncbi:reverse transcriptase [Plakobranchus ocellatus]|uniref:Reverse transcriptase n=1 Tax=Plakobranchus ocellatus TaxID=259542 RepID=A0AAV4DKZ0_9GAST|nr:reverse transcriptase [Plakobranchus ocellatus]
MAWQFIRRVSGRGNTARVEPLIVNGTEMNTDRREADAFNKHLSKVNTVPRDPIADPRMRRLRKALERRPTASNCTFETEFTVTELDIALRKGKPGKAPGLDGVTQEMIFQLSPKAKSVLLNLFNLTWKSGELPRAWRTAVLVPILKKGKCATAAGSYRPISLTSVISKTMERMVNARLYHYLEQRACLDESQSGFRRHRTTVDQLVRFTQSVINAWQSKSHTVAVFVDLEKAYDRVWRTGLEVRLQEHGITGRMYRWLKAFLTERFIRTRIKGTLSRTRPLADGLPQGSALSCTLFLIFMNKIGNAVHTPNRLSYADDLVLWQKDTDIDKATEAINRDLASLKCFCERWKMRINTGKTAFTIFSLSNPVLKSVLDIRIGSDSLQRDNLPSTRNHREFRKAVRNSIYGRLLNPGNGGYGIYFLWPDGSTTQKCGPLGERTCSYECELTAVTECLKVVIEKQQQAAALPGVVILTDCRALVQALGGSRSENVREAVLLADHLLKTEGVQTTVQWIPSHIGILGNEIADRLANEGRKMPQPQKPVTRSVLQHGTAKLWSAAQLTDDERIPRFYEACKARDLLQNLPRSDAVQIFRARAKHTLLMADGARHGWSLTTACRLCEEQEETIAHVLSECREMADVRPGGWPTVSVNEILWYGNRVAMSTAAKIMRKFLQRAMR